LGSPAEIIVGFNLEYKHSNDSCTSFSIISLDVFLFTGGNKIPAIYDLPVRIFTGNAEWVEGIEKK
jgi:hypothetical protein